MGPMDQIGSYPNTTFGLVHAIQTYPELLAQNLLPVLLFLALFTDTVKNLHASCLRQLHFFV